jgi:hypothetical protein
MYKTEKFELRTPAEVKADIDQVADLCQRLKDLSWKLGFGGSITREAAIELLNAEPELNYNQGFVMVYNWIQSGAKTAFLQDANSLVMKSEQLVDILQHLRKTFPTLNRVTSYARSKSIAQKKLEELVAIREAGLDRVHIGLETGDDELLKKIRKGVTADGHIKGGKKAMEAGFQLSEYWMPGLGGKEMWQNHAINTARVLNNINPHYIRSRPFNPLPGTGLQEQVAAGKMTLLSADEQLTELKLMMENLDVTSKVCFDHAANYWLNRHGGLLFTHSYEGYKFPEEKNRVLKLIDHGLQANNRRPEILNL